MRRAGYQVSGLRRARPLILIALLALAPPVRADGAGFKIIVNPDNPTTELTAREVSRLLLKQKARWDHGVPVQPVDLDGGSSVRAALSKAVHGRSVSSIKNYWQRQAGAGAAEPPPELEGDAAVLSYVKSHKGAIGYVSPRARLDGVKVLDLASR